MLMKNNIIFKDGERIIGPGTVYERGKIIYGSAPLTFGENLYYIDAQAVQLNANATLQETCTISGNATIDGSLNSLYLTHCGSIIV